MGTAVSYGSGDYRLTLAKTGDPVVVSAGDNGGPMTNGVMHLGTILTGRSGPVDVHGQQRGQPRGADGRDHRHQHVLHLGAVVRSGRRAAQVEF